MLERRAAEDSGMNSRTILVEAVDTKTQTLNPDCSKWIVGEPCASADASKPIARAPPGLRPPAAR